MDSCLVYSVLCIVYCTFCVQRYEKNRTAQGCNFNRLQPWSFVEYRFVLFGGTFTAGVRLASELHSNRHFSVAVDAEHPSQVRTVGILNIVQGGSLMHTRVAYTQTGDTCHGDTCAC